MYTQSTILLYPLYNIYIYVIIYPHDIHIVSGCPFICDKQLRQAQQLAGPLEAKEGQTSGKGDVRSPRFVFLRVKAQEVAWV